VALAVQALLLLQLRLASLRFGRQLEVASAVQALL
jgi:hypothetical protein